MHDKHQRRPDSRYRVSELPFTYQLDASQEDPSSRYIKIVSDIDFFPLRL